MPHGALLRGGGAVRQQLRPNVAGGEILESQAGKLLDLALSFVGGDQVNPSEGWCNLLRTPMRLHASSILVTIAAHDVGCPPGAGGGIRVTPHEVLGVTEGVSHLVDTRTRARGTRWTVSHRVFCTPIRIYGA